MSTQTREFVAAEKQAGNNAAKACVLLDVSRSAFYDSINRPASARETSDAELTVMITAAHQRSRGTYGAPRVHDELTEAGVHVGRKLVARLMADAGLVGVCARRSRRTTIAGEEVRALTSSTGSSGRTTGRSIGPGARTSPTSGPGRAGPTW